MGKESYDTTTQNQCAKWDWLYVFSLAGPILARAVVESTAVLDLVGLGCIQPK
jgi:hypothetical protein